MPFFVLEHPDGCCTLNYLLKTLWWMLYPKLFLENTLLGAVQKIILYIFFYYTLNSFLVFALMGLLP